MNKSYYKINAESIINLFDIGIIKASFSNIQEACAILSEPELKLWIALCENYTDIPSNWFRDKLDESGMKVGKSAWNMKYEVNNENK